MPSSPSIVQVPESFPALESGFLDFGGGQNIICGCNSKRSENGYIGVCRFCGGIRFFAQDLSGFASEMMPQNPGSDINLYSGSHVAVIIDGKPVIFNQNVGDSTGKRAVKPAL